MGNVPTFERLGRYRLVRRIGRGGMATVYRAVQEGPHGFENEVAVKLIHADVLAAYPQILKMLVDEARIAARIHHPNVVRILDLIQEADRFYMVMDYVDGVSMRDILDQARKRGDRLDLAPVISVLAAACDGLHAAHSLMGPDGEPAGLVHRDVKPGNILVSAEGEVKVGDFGIALFSDRLAEATAHGQLKGTPAYMSPEQAIGDPLDARSDVFSMGMSLYTLVTTKLAFTGESPMAIAVQIANESMERHAEELEGIHPGLGAVLDRACAHEPQDRFAGAEKLATALREVSEGLDEDVSIRDMLLWAGWDGNAIAEEDEDEGGVREGDPGVFLDDELDTDPGLPATPDGKMTEGQHPGESPALTEEAATTVDDIPALPSETEETEETETDADPDPGPTPAARDDDEATVSHSGPVQSEIIIPDDRSEPESPTQPGFAYPASGDAPTPANLSIPAALVNETTHFQPERDYRGRVVKRKQVDPDTLRIGRSEKLAIAVTIGLLGAVLAAILIVQVIQDDQPMRDPRFLEEPGEAAGDVLPQEAGPVATAPADPEPEAAPGAASPTEVTEAEPEPAPESTLARSEVPPTPEPTPATSLKKKEKKPDAPARAAASRRSTPSDATATTPPPRGDGKLTVNTYPYSQVYLNGAYRGLTPMVRLQVPAGEHQVRLVFPTRDNQEIEQTVTVKDGDEARVVHRLEDEE